jgi:hypothetical protein
MRAARVLFVNLDVDESFAAKCGAANQGCTHYAYSEFG